MRWPPERWGRDKEIWRLWSVESPAPSLPYKSMLSHDWFFFFFSQLHFNLAQLLFHYCSSDSVLIEAAGSYLSHSPTYKEGGRRRVWVRGSPGWWGSQGNGHLQQKDQGFQRWGKVGALWRIAEWSNKSAGRTGELQRRKGVIMTYTRYQTLL